MKYNDNQKYDQVDDIITKCRYNPRVSLGEVSGEDDKVIKRVKEWNKKEDKLK